MYRFIGPISLVTGGAMTGTAVLTSNAINIETLPLAGVYISWTGTPQGSFSLQGSIDGTHFADMGISIPAPGGSAGSCLIDPITTSCRFLRVKYTNSSSTGTLTVTACGKSK